MTQFKYDIITLLELVKARPCLWEKSNKFKSKYDVQSAWNEIFRVLEERYEELGNKERKEVGDKIKTKWVNIKDAFFKSLKTKPGQEAKKTYVYAQYLQFLLKFSPNGHKTDSYSNTGSYTEQVEDIKSKSFAVADEGSIEYIYQSPKPKRAKQVAISTVKLENIETKFIEEAKDTGLLTTFSLSDEDDKFFSSFVPYLKDMSESEKMDLQMDILNCIKKIKQKRYQT